MDYSQILAFKASSRLSHIYPDRPFHSETNSTHISEYTVELLIKRITLVIRHYPSLPDIGYPFNRWVG